MQTNQQASNTVTPVKPTGCCPAYLQSDRQLGVAPCSECHIYEDTHEGRERRHRGGSVCGCGAVSVTQCHGKVVTRKNRGEVASPAAALFTADSGSSVVALQWHTFTLLLIYELPLPCASHGSAWCRSVACVAPLSRPEVVDDTAS